MKVNYTSFYTGHNWLAEEGDDSQIYQAQCVAVSEDGIHFRKERHYLTATTRIYALS